MWVVDRLEWHSRLLKSDRLTSSGAKGNAAAMPTWHFLTNQTLSDCAMQHSVSIIDTYGGRFCQSCHLVTFAMFCSVAIVGRYKARGGVQGRGA